jgi:hypothetical protein
MLLKKFILGVEANILTLFKEAYGVDVYTD